MKAESIRMLAMAAIFAPLLLVGCSSTEEKIYPISAAMTPMGPDDEASMQPTSPRAPVNQVPMPSFGFGRF